MASTAFVFCIACHNCDIRSPDSGLGGTICSPFRFLLQSTAVYDEAGGMMINDDADDGCIIVKYHCVLCYKL